MHQKLTELGHSLEGEFHTGQTMRLLYATDASVYKELPLAVAIPRNKNDIRKILDFSGKFKIPVIPRTAGTSLAGQVVGNGIVVDVSKHLNKIIELNVAEHWVKVEPGVVLDELNKYLAASGLFFGPETSTSNRCMIGGMVGNNSCGSHSIIYGSTRDHTISVNAFLSDGSEVEFKPLSKEEFDQKCFGDNLENRIYRQLRQVLSDRLNQEEIRKEFPDPALHRRNTGYAIDILLETDPFTGNGKPFNMTKLIAGSEGTLAFITEIKLNLVPLPPSETGVVAAHFDTVNQALLANLIALKYKPGAVELMDKIILDCTRYSIEHSKNRFFVKGDPGAILMIEFARETREEIQQLASSMETEMRNAGLGYYFPLLFIPETKKVWDLRKAGLGLLSNIPGDAQSVAVIEDTAVSCESLPAYIEEFQKILAKHHLTCVYYAHVGSGELHLKPVLNLKDKKDVDLFHTIASEIAVLVKKYRGSLSGEHGDGRLRGEFIPFMIGEKNYRLLKEIKQTWDPDHIFNPGKITDTPSITSSFRVEPGTLPPQIKTYFDYSSTEGFVRAVEKCNGSADCRKTEVIGGTMCPSYMATRNEYDTTRARANILRDFIYRPGSKDPLNHKEIYEVMDLCLSCKACKSECPSGVDMAKFKAEFLQHYYDANGIPFRAWMIAHISSISKIGSLVPDLTNFFFKNKTASGLLKRWLGFARERQIPHLSGLTLGAWMKKKTEPENKSGSKGKVYLFNDEFTNYNEPEIGIKAILLLEKLGYTVIIPRHLESGRAYLSKGLVRKAKKIASKNVALLSSIISPSTPLIGIEPSAILAFRDEYPELVPDELRDSARKIAENSFMLEEFLEKEIEKGNIDKSSFTGNKLHIRLHGHCQQKAIASTSPTKKILSFPENYTVEEIPSGCCGMAGSFGYEKEHYDVSMKIGELVLFPEIRKTDEDVLICAPGTSCRHQIADGTSRRAYHPAEILYDALVNDLKM
ncbi:MAG: FAD-binding protein [Bacteroidia bacterium]|nr:FAD-binding protein [Bacteroidia bacterium]